MSKRLRNKLMTKVEYCEAELAAARARLRHIEERMEGERSPRRWDYLRDELADAIEMVERHEADLESARDEEQAADAAPKRERYW